MDVGEPFLHDPEQGYLNFLRQPAEARREIEIDPDAGSFRIAVDVAADGGVQSGFPRRFVALSGDSRFENRCSHSRSFYRVDSESEGWSGFLEQLRQSLNARNQRWQRCHNHRREGFAVLKRFPGQRH